MIGCPRHWRLGIGISRLCCKCARNYISYTKHFRCTFIASKFNYLLAFNSCVDSFFSKRIFSIIPRMAFSSTDAVCAGKMLNNRFFCNEILKNKKKTILFSRKNYYFFLTFHCSHTSWSRAYRNNRFPSTHSRRSRNALRIATSVCNRTYTPKKLIPSKYTRSVKI